MVPSHRKKNEISGSENRWMDGYNYSDWYGTCWQMRQGTLAVTWRGPYMATIRIRGEMNCISGMGNFGLQTHSEWTLHSVIFKKLFHKPKIFFPKRWWTFYADFPRMNRGGGGGSRKIQEIIKNLKKYSKKRKRNLHICKLANAELQGSTVVLYCNTVSAAL